MRRGVLSTSGVAAVGFATTFGAVRALTYAIHVGIGPFHNVSAGGTHIHHMVWGILLLLAVGYVRFLRDCLGASSIPAWFARLMAAAYAAGAALTLDEFALWLNMRDVYWQLEGWESITAVLIFAGLLSVGIWGRRLAWAPAGTFVQRQGDALRLPRAADLVAAGTGRTLTAKLATQVLSDNRKRDRDAALAESNVL